MINKQDTITIQSNSYIMWEKMSQIKDTFLDRPKERYDSHS